MLDKLLPSEWVICEKMMEPARCALANIGDGRKKTSFGGKETPPELQKVVTERERS
jgi:hypothetical protein